MAKSMRCKREKRLRAIKRELVQPIYEKKEAAKQAVLEAALNAPKLPVKPTASTSMEIVDASAASSLAGPDGMEFEMIGSNQNSRSLKPLGKKMKKKIKIAKKKGHRKGKIRRKNV